MRLALALGLPLLLLACEPANTHALARVNGVEISARQLPNPQALEKIIDRELLVQKALEAKLDKDPAVVEHIDNARRQVLAQAYVERVSGGYAKPSRDEVRAFYNDNPALFAERRIYRIRELTVAEPAEIAEGDLEQMVAALRSRGARFSLTTQTQPAEELPLAYLPKLARMKPGEVAVFGRTAIQLIHAEDAPLAPEQAYALIEQFLAGKKRMELAAAEVKKLREGARIEYVAQVKR
ncbi:MAG TPA: EpsD family peptidyl-prolyl cis-trans isomerase [Burkholderiales bacterium]|nr:EpsD family peptidyl-prolyl cis-trans isomerase [Burkholderiales bacterium]